MYTSADSVTRVSSEQSDESHEAASEPSEPSESAEAVSFDLGALSDDDRQQVKQAINELLTDPTLPSVADLAEVDQPPHEIYRFSTEVVFKPIASASDGETRIEIIGFDGEVLFRGETSLDNWGSSDHLSNAMRVDDTYPLQGLVTPVSRTEGDAAYDEYVVTFLFVCAPDAESIEHWHKRQTLRRERITPVSERN